jgi:hypothetical protein
LIDRANFLLSGDIPSPIAEAIRQRAGSPESGTEDVPKTPPRGRQEKHPKFNGRRERDHLSRLQQTNKSLEANSPRQFQHEMLKPQFLTYAVAGAARRERGILTTPGRIWMPRGFRTVR